MKKTILFIGIIALSCGFLGAQDEAYRKAKILIEGGLSANLGAIRAEAARLDTSQKYRLFEDYSKVGNQKNLLGAGVNFLAGFGIGSYIIGDISAGILGTVLDVGGYACFFVGYVKCYINALVNMSQGFMWTTDSWPYLGLMVGGLAVKLGSTIYQCLSPFGYARGYDAVLEEALGLASAPEVRPYIGSSPSGGASLGICLSW